MKVINDYTCEKCGVIELLADPELVQICEICKTPLKKEIGKLIVLHPMKSYWHRDDRKKVQ